MLISYIKALHIIFIVTWFAGLFYIVRLFIYHTEASQKGEPEKSILEKQFMIMEKRLWFGITWPSAVLAWIFGIWLISFNTGYYLSSSWFLTKLAFVIALTAYHLTCHKMFRELQHGIIKHSSAKLRVWNEVATIILVAVVFIVEVQRGMSAVYGLLGLAAFTALLMLAIRIYKRSQEKQPNT